jgi:hypothetical protein
MGSRAQDLRFGEAPRDTGLHRRRLVLLAGPWTSDLVYRHVRTDGDDRDPCREVPEGATLTGTCVQHLPADILPSEFFNFLSHAGWKDLGCVHIRVDDEPGLESDGGARDS